MARWRDGSGCARQRAVAARLERERALPHRRQQDLRREALVDPLGEAESLQAGAGEDHGVEPLARELAQAGRNVAAKRRDLEVGAARPQLRGPAQAPGADPGADRQRRERGAALARDQRIARIRPLGKRHQRELRRQHGRQVLRAVHREIGPAVQQRVLDLLDEQALAAQLGERHRGETVALGLDRHQLGPAAERPLELIGHLARLGERELAGARGDAQRRHDSSVGSAPSVPSLPSAGSSRSKSTRAVSRYTIPSSRSASRRRRDTGACRILLTSERVSASTAAR